MKRQATIITIFAIISYCSILITTVWANEEVIEWKLQSQFFESDRGFSITSKNVVNMLSEATNGKLKVTPYHCGAIVSQEEMLRSTMIGVVEMSHSIAAIPGLVIPEAYLLSIHGSSKSLAQQYDLIYRKGIIELVREGFKKKGLHFLCVGLSSPLATMSKFKVTKWADYKGKKGWAEPVTGDVIPSLGGGVCIPVPGWDMYSAMKLGSIEWFHWTIGELEDMNLKEVVKYCIVDPVIFQPCDAVYVNQKAWDKLGAEMQNQIEAYISENIIKTAYDFRDTDEIGAQKAMDYGVQFIKMEKSEIERYYETCYKDWDRIAEMSPLCAKGIEIVRKQAKRLIEY